MTGFPPSKSGLSHVSSQDLLSYLGISRFLGASGVSVYKRDLMVNILEYYIGLKSSFITDWVQENMSNYSFTKWILSQSRFVSFQRFSGSVDVFCLDSELVFFALFQALDWHRGSWPQPGHLLPGRRTLFLFLNNVSCGKFEKLWETTCIRKRANLTIVFKFCSLF